MVVIWQAVGLIVYGVPDSQMFWGKFGWHGRYLCLTSLHGRQEKQRSKVACLTRFVVTDTRVHKRECMLVPYQRVHVPL